MGVIEEISGFTCYVSPLVRRQVETCIFIQLPPNKIVTVVEKLSWYFIILHSLGNLPQC